MKNRATGFTLIDLLTSMVVFSVLAAVVYPSYLSQLRKSRRAEATTELVAMAQAQERFFARFRTYTSVVTAPDPCAGQACGLEKNSNLSANEYYVLTSNGDATSYTLTATANGPQFDDIDCRTFSINNVDVRSATDASSQDSTDECW